MSEYPEGHQKYRNPKGFPHGKWILLAMALGLLALMITVSVMTDNLADQMDAAVEQAEAARGD